MIALFLLSLVIMIFATIVGFTGWPFSTVEAKQIGLSAVFIWLLLIFLLNFEAVRRFWDGDALEKFCLALIFALLAAPFVAIFTVPQAAIATTQVLSGAFIGAVVYFVLSRPFLVEAVP